MNHYALIDTTRYHCSARLPAVEQSSVVIHSQTASLFVVLGMAVVAMLNKNRPDLFLEKLQTLLLVYLLSQESFAG
ncbi:MAG: hypothetical protein ACKN85_12830 [Pirellula sp.]